uniref:Uncharacterized protein n=1 Tax=uncultured nuHF2 cluster bacterium HF0130_29D04 TaxID=723587 RepID=E7C3C8_9BACT|nr:hypothetical protein [uncultured nuHF2 cluster bacterium HF0130_29D04]
MKIIDLFIWIFSGRKFLITGLLLLFLEQLVVNPVFSEPKSSMFHLRLLDRLDRPEDGYCIDILGTPGNLRVELPLFAHNCKTTLTADSSVIFTSDGLIKFPAVDLCVTVAGVNSNALPGASTLLRKCSESKPFFETFRLQRFTHRKDGRISMSGSELCLAVGRESAATYSPSHRWRALFVEDCSVAEASLSQWEFVVPDH